MKIANLKRRDRNELFKTYFMFIYIYILLDFYILCLKILRRLFFKKQEYCGIRFFAITHIIKLLGYI